MTDQLHIFFLIFVFVDGIYTCFSVASKERNNRLTAITAALMANRPEHGSALRSFNLKNFCTPNALTTNYPELVYLKAAEVRGMVPVMLELISPFANDSSVWRIRLKMCESLEAMYSIIHDADVVLSPREYSNFKAAVMKFLQCYTYLSRNALDNGLVQYNVTPKFHYLYHLCQRGEWLNPRMVWCYGSEDFVGKASKLGMSCSYGTPVYEVPSKLISKYRIGVWIEWTRS